MTASPRDIEKLKNSAIFGRPMPRPKPTAESDASRFGKKVIRIDGPSAHCWEWLAQRDPKGYGRFWLRGAPYPAHRFAYEMENGKLPKSLVIDHLCRNHGCVRPSHMEAVANAENIRRGSRAVGEAHHGARLTVAAVREIRAAKANGGPRWGSEGLAKKFGVSRRMVSLVANGNNWRHVR